MQDDEKKDENVSPSETTANDDLYESSSDIDDTFDEENPSDIVDDFDDDFSDDDWDEFSDDADSSSSIAAIKKKSISAGDQKTFLQKYFYYVVGGVVGFFFLIFLLSQPSETPERPPLQAQQTQDSASKEMSEAPAGFLANPELFDESVYMDTPEEEITLPMPAPIAPEETTKQEIEIEYAKKMSLEFDNMPSPKLMDGMSIDNSNAAENSKSVEAETEMEDSFFDEPIQITTQQASQTTNTKSQNEEIVPEIAGSSFPANLGQTDRSPVEIRKPVITTASSDDINMISDRVDQLEALIHEKNRELERKIDRLNDLLEKIDTKTTQKTVKKYKNHQNLLKSPLNLRKNHKI